MASNLFEKIWDAHVVGERLIYVDLHLVHEVTSPQAFDGLRMAGRTVRRPDLTVATMDHNVPTTDGPITDPLARAQLEALRRNCDEFDVPLYATGSGREGIVHVIGPELGLTQPGTTIVCGFACGSVCVASTCSTSDVPTPNASAPNAPCVDVWLSPQTMVIPGCVCPSSGPITCTMPRLSEPRS